MYPLYTPPAGKRVPELLSKHDVRGRRTGANHLQNQLKVTRPCKGEGEQERKERAKGERGMMSRKSPRNPDEEDDDSDDDADPDPDDSDVYDDDDGGGGEDDGDDGDDDADGDGDGVDGDDDDDDEIDPEEVEFTTWASADTAGTPSKHLKEIGRTTRSSPDPLTLPHTPRDPRCPTTSGSRPALVPSAVLYII